MNIGVISDTHDLLRPEVIGALQSCEHILHSGDISSRAVLERLEQIAPVSVVRGNNDGGWAEYLPQSLDFGLGGLHIFMTHKKKDLPEDLSAFDLVIYGHSHQYASKWLSPAGRRRTLLLNPGSCGPRRFHQPITMALLTVDADGWTVKRIGIPHSPKEAAPKKGADILKVIVTVIGETQKGRTPEDIAAGHGLDPELTGRIARLYLTHPGITADGIMEKMGL